MSKTIAAISTGLTPSGISIIRMSGPQAVEIADRIVRTRKLKTLTEAESHKLYYGFAYDGEQVLDEVLVSVMRAPHTFTGEDIAEINSHGGMLVAREILDCLLKNGAVPAEPGEFTKRAFLNGRMDLSRAEAVIGVINAGNEFALKAAAQQLKGDVSEKIRNLRNRILDEVSFIEAALDDPEHYDLSGYGDVLLERLQSVSREIQEMVLRSDDGAILAEGIRTVIAGRPNAGKSSLLNLLAGQEKAIVTEIAGTTRDILEVPVRMGDISLILMDTAGLRETEDTVEKIGVERAKKAIQDADLVLYLLDASQGETEEDREALKTFSGKKVIVLLNKSDLLKETEAGNCAADEVENNQKQESELSYTEGTVENHPIGFSVLTREGLDELRQRIRDLFHASEIMENDEILITGARQKALLSDALKSVNRAMEGARNGDSEEFLTVDLMDAYASLGKMIGEEVEDDVINRVFEKFCMGK